LAALSACEAPFGLGLPSTLALESGVAGSLSGAASFEIAGSYVDAGVRWTVDLQLVRPQTEHALVTQGTTQLEAVVVGGKAFFRGQDFLSVHLGAASSARTLVRAAGHAWWTGTTADLPDPTDFTNGARFRLTFLGPVVNLRTDHVDVGGVDAVELSGSRADVYVSEGAPYRLLRVHMARGAVVDGIAAADFRFSNFGRDFGIVAPTNVIDFSNLSTLPPLYTVESVDTSGCGSPCSVSALVKNLGGKTGASAPSTVTFTLVDPASGSVLGACSTPVQPDVDYNSTATVSCTITSTSGQPFNSATVTAVPVNPGRA